MDLKNDGKRPWPKSINYSSMNPDPGTREPTQTELNKCGISDQDPSHENTQRSLLAITRSSYCFPITAWLACRRTIHFWQLAIFPSSLVRYIKLNYLRSQLIFVVLNINDRIQQKMEVLKPLILQVLTPECYDEFFLNFNFLDGKQITYLEDIYFKLNVFHGYCFHTWYPFSL